MNDLWKDSLWKQFGAAIDTLEDAIHLCTDELWLGQLWEDEDDPMYGQVWWICYHTLSWLDLFLGGSYTDFKPPEPFVRGVLPDAPYSRDTIMTYLASCRKKSQETIAAMTEEQAEKVCVFDWMQPTYYELQLYSMRHIMEHAAQVNLFLGQHGITGQDWVPSARTNTD